MLAIHHHQLLYTSKRQSESDPIKVFLIQEQYPEQLIGRRAGEGIYVGRMNAGDSPEDFREVIEAMLARIPEDTDLAVVSEHPGNASALNLYQQQADRNQQLIIVRLGYHMRDNTNQITNSVAVITPHHEPVIVAQISFSTEDLKFHAQGKLHPGEEINLFSTPLGNIAVISCHDYTHADVLENISKHNIEMLVVSSFNPGTRLFRQYALADIHRFSCFVIISNIANYGGSGVFAPFRYNGPKRASMSLGGALAYTQGETRAYLEANLPIADLRRLRQGQSSGIDSYEDAINWTPIYPSEEYRTPGEPDYMKRLQSPDGLEKVDLQRAGYIPIHEQEELNIAVVQLKCMDKESYLNNYYCISCSHNASEFIHKVRTHLEFLAGQLEENGQSLDFLVFPELFLPLTMEPYLQDFARRFNTIIIGGVEYDPQPDTLESPEKAVGANRCFIYVPVGSGEVKRFQYQKLTHSQYDALLPPKEECDSDHFQMIRGEKLLRFTWGESWSFGVLICYDYSHFGIIHRINSDVDHSLPLDILFIVANNPDTQLYERCCLADSHRFYQYIVMANVGQFGGSGVYGPVKTPGRRQVLLNSGVGTENISISTVPLAKLREARKAGKLPRGSDFQNKPGIFQR
jgi:predicted amidohydrolase